ncbi:MAG TPA: hypothetical protein DCQ26_07270 [Marinilabiliales bacterium]|jgi:outer membrane receptor protein involved in Fe transport|nr:MAG: hypothetical protein A2W95_14245 [Bacteroidetes bacterium GWA2_40_14]OFX56602.1 MAG: hypothetical protein A2W84_07380 [Bacteroidetes bacterium GWC2_40_13]OFX71832.1 MAG: hypothetical protein A2W96_06275 [Bacteroidetes bacterium GWD2_40_43]OFX94630.1 MAG: hypothetical protein A2W97_18080 [Bacteroidetes bacterium GWE2_40_63]OFY21918.1 MAG: hypothetical protein A2W88_12290 [Bacteroidetes bacterium GWF2_40_13]OFZ24396.1 MAG: hypothetical protein A2437_18210 [Bacteroidetes bacterium RIFOXYC
MNKQFLLITIIFVLQVTVYSQNGTISGKLTENQNGQQVPLPFANIFLEGTTMGSTSDFDGNFRFQAPSGNYTLMCSFMGYETFKRAVVLSPGGSLELTIEMKPEGVALEGVDVVAKVNRESELALVMEQKEATVSVERLGARELSRKGASNVAAGVKKMVGVSMIGNDQLFVRGMGDRYNSLMLNGLPLASPNPDKKIIPLDIFPSEIVQNIGLSKVFDVQNYASYAGANIDIVTKDYAEEPFMEIKIGTGFNTLALNKTFKSATSPASNVESFFGVGAKNRYNAMPEDFKQITITPNKYYTEDPYGSSFAYKTTEGKPELSLGITGGRTFKLRNDQKLGTLFTVAFDNKYETVTGYDNILNAQGGINSSYDYQKYTYETNLTGLANLAYLINPKHSIKYNFLLINSSEDRFKVKEGKSAEGDIRTINNYRMRIYRLYNSQLIGDHQLGGHLSLEWKSSYSIAYSTEPDRRTMTYERDVDESYFTLYTLDQQGSMRYFNEFNEKEINGGAKLKYILSEKNEIKKSWIHVGVDGRKKDRDFKANKSYYTLDALTNDSINPSNPTDLLNDQNFVDSLIQLKNFSIKEDQYDANFTTLAGFADYVNTFGAFTMDLGIRWEYFFMESNFLYGGVKYGKIKVPAGIYPSVNLKYSLNEKMNLRFGASRTVTYPSFTEFAPLLYSEYGELSSIGNPELTTGFNNNVDIKWELFPNPGDLVSVNLFGKLLQDPIEKTAITVAGDQGYSYQNTEDGLVGGIEIDAKKKWNQFFGGLNFSYIYSHIKLPESSANTTKERELQGASPILINADLGYLFKFGLDDKNEISASFVYNYYSKRLFAVGVSGRGDIYENAFHTLDFVAKSNINEKWEIGFKARNLFDQNIEFIQEYFDANNIKGEKSIEKYNKGQSLSMSVTYNF